VPKPRVLPRVLYIGDGDWADSAEFDRLWANVELAEVGDITAACKLAFAEGAHFDLIVVAQKRPGQLSPKMLESLRKAAPLTPIVCVAGSFCEGEARTGRPWPGAVRVYAHQFVARVAAQLERLAAVGAMSWAPPFTNTEEDRLLNAAPMPPAHLATRVAVFSHERQSAAMLCDALEAAGYAAVTCEPTDELRDIDLVLWDCAGSFAACRDRFIRMAQQTPAAAKIVLLGFPRPEDVATARAAGATAVLSKPFLLDDLLWQVRDCLNAARSTGLQSPFLQAPPIA
jgi:CheY-like chemotaxis protein